MVTAFVISTVADSGTRPGERLGGHARLTAVIGLALILAAVATSVLAALAVRLESLVSTLLAAYIAFVADLGLVTLVLSPANDVTRGGLAAAQTLLLAAAAGIWWLRGRPGPGLVRAGQALSGVLRDPVTAVFLAVVVGVLAYELLLALTVPPNNWDSLTYHLARAASWAQQGGIHWIPNAPTDRMNEFQPLAEQQILFFFVATGGGGLFALPQFLAELAILVAVYGSARRLGYGPRPAACASLLTATFTLFAVEAMTAQNDLVAASFPAAAACLLLGSEAGEQVLAGAAVGLGLGVKLTTILVLPVLIWLAALRGRRALLLGLAGGVAAFVAIGMWGFVLNEIHTGHLLGYGASRKTATASPSYPGSVLTGLYLVYQTLDLGVLTDRRVHLLALAGVVAAAVALVVVLRQRHRPVDAAATAGRTALPFLAPLLVIGASGVLAWLVRRWGYPARGSGGVVGDINRTSNEDYAAFGPIGAVTLLWLPFLVAASFVARRADARKLALGLALPVCLVFLALGTKYSPFLTRFLLVPAALAAPLLARFFRGRAATAAYAAVGVILVALALAHDPTKALGSSEGRPWSLTQVQALREAGDPQAAAGLAALQQALPAHACLGAVLGLDDPSYLLWGKDRQNRVTFLPVNGALDAAERAGLFYVVITTGVDRAAADEFKAAGWQIEPLGGYWLLAVGPHAAGYACSA
jgi:Glycosyltransferase family 87